MTAGSALFVDANVLVYFTFAHFPWHRAARDRLAALESLPTLLTTNRQVLREFLAVTTRPGFLTPLPPIAFLQETVIGFEDRFQIVADEQQVRALLLELVATPGAQGRQVHDANLVATMRRHQIPYLLTHNTTDFDRYQSWITVLPLVS